MNNMLILLTINGCVIGLSLLLCPLLAWLLPDRTTA